MEQRPEAIAFENINLSDPALLDEEPKRLPYRRRRCTIIVTLVDPKITPVDIQKMLEAGMNIAKFKMSYSTMGDKLRLLGKIDKAALTCCTKNFVSDWPVATCVELKTGIVKTGMLEGDKECVLLTDGKQILLTNDITFYNKCNERKVFVDNQYLTTDIKVGTEISIDSAEIILQCTQIIDGKTIKCIIVKGGKLTNVCNVSARIGKRTGPYTSKNDLDIVRFAVEYQVDMILVNYSRHMETLQKIKQYIGKKIKRPLLISGICTEEGLDNFDEIMKESDGIVLSREYLPYELEPSKCLRLTRIQKWMTAKCLMAGKPLFISGIFKNAIKNKNFEDAEIFDVTNSIIDGVSGFLLKDCFETDNVLEVLNALNKLCYFIEPLLTNTSEFWRVTEAPRQPLNAAEAAVMSCAAAANLTNASLVIIPTVTGKTVKALHLMRLSCIIITLSTNNRVSRLLCTYRGVYPMLYTGPSHKKWNETVDARVHYAIEYAVKRAWVTYGDTYITLERATEASSFCETVRIWKVAIAKKSLVECPEEIVYY